MRRILAVLSAVVVVNAFAATAWACHGACCLPDGTCIDNWDTNWCAAYDGEHFGEGSVCADVVCEPTPICRVTGGGVDCYGGVFVPGECQGAVGKMKRSPGIDTSTFGGQVGAPGSVFGEWTHVNHSGPSGKWTFHGGTASAPDGTFMEVVACSDEPACNPAAANGFHKQIDIVGVGTFKNGTPRPEVAVGDLCNVTIHIEDLGEPGKGKNGQQPDDNGCLEGGHAGLLVDDFGDCGCPDFYEIRISCDVGGVATEVYVHSGYITAGNLQMHASLD